MTTLYRKEHWTAVLFPYIVCRCSADFLVMVIQFTILIPLLKKMKNSNSIYQVFLSNTNNLPSAIWFEILFSND